MKQNIVQCNSYGAFKCLKFFLKKHQRGRSITKYDPWFENTRIIKLLGSYGHKGNPDFLIILEMCVNLESQTTELTLIPRHCEVEKRW